MGDLRFANYDLRFEGGSKINREGREEREEKNGAGIIYFIIH
jgi:hypothetical protein